MIELDGGPLTLEAVEAVAASNARPSRSRTRCSSAAMRISSKTESRLLVQPPSLPSPTLTPALRSSGSRVIPSPRNMLELGQ